MKIVARSGGTTVEISPELAAFVDRLTKAAAPTTRATMDREIGRVYDNAVDQWPVKTGRSKAALEHGIAVESADVVRGFVACDVGYARYIKSLKLPGTGSAFVELLRKPMKKAVEPIVEALAEDLARAGVR